MAEATVRAWENGTRSLAGVPAPQLEHLKSILTEAGAEPAIVADLDAAAWCDLVILAAAEEIEQTAPAARGPPPGAPGSLQATPAPLNAGGEFATLGGRHFNGIIDDARVYNRALSAAEVAQVYNAGIHQGLVDGMAASHVLGQTLHVVSGIALIGTRDGTIPQTSPPPPELKRFVDSEIARWGKVVEKAGLAGSE